MAKARHDFASGTRLRWLGAAGSQRRPLELLNLVLVCRAGPCLIKAFRLPAIGHNRQNARGFWSHHVEQDAPTVAVRICAIRLYKAIPLTGYLVGREQSDGDGSRFFLGNFWTVFKQGREEHCGCCVDETGGPNDGATVRVAAALRRAALPVPVPVRDRPPRCSAR